VGGQAAAQVLREIRIFQQKRQRVVPPPRPAQAFPPVHLPPQTVGVRQPLRLPAGPVDLLQELHVARVYRELHGDDPARVAELLCGGAGAGACLVGPELAQGKRGPFAGLLFQRAGVVRRERLCLEGAEHPGGALV